jgi:integrase
MASVIDRKTTWQISWSADGRRHWERLDKAQFSKRKAKREANKREAEGSSSVKKVHTFKELMEAALLFRKIVPSTRYKIDKFVQQFEAFLLSRGAGQDVGDITAGMVNEYWMEKQKTYKPASVNFDLAYLRQSFKKGVAMGWVKGNPLDGVRYITEKRHVKQLPTKDEVERILRWFRFNELLFYPWVYFEMTRGWRRDELRLMKVADVDLSAEVLDVKHTKTGVERKERLEEEDCLVLNEHFIQLKKAKLYKPTGYLFPAKNGGLICKNTLLRKVKQAAKAVGITKNITNHLFRHYVVTSILDSTANIEVVKAITGHKDTKTILEHYAHATPENVKRGLEITKIDTGLKVKAVSNNVSNKG